MGLLEGLLCLYFVGVSVGFLQGLCEVESENGVVSYTVLMISVSLSLKVSQILYLL